MKIASIHKAHDDDHTASRRKDLGVELPKHTPKTAPSTDRPDAHRKQQSPKK